MRRTYLAIGIWALALVAIGRSAPQPEPLSNYIVVSDIDDTIKWTHVLGPQILAWGLDPHTAFKGMPELYDKLARAGARIVYVTGFLHTRITELNIPLKTVNKNHFPLKDPGDIYLHGEGGSTETFKVRTIRALMRDNPQNSFILIGDNGQRDIYSYETIQHDPALAPRVKRVFIHEIYSGPPSSEPKPDQQPYVTAAELAGFLFQLNYIDENDFASIVKKVYDGITSHKSNARNLTLPFAAQLVASKVDAIYRAIPSVASSDPKTQSMLERIHEILIEQARKGPRRF